MHKVIELVLTSGSSASTPVRLHPISISWKENLGCRQVVFVNIPPLMCMTHFTLRSFSGMRSNLDLEFLGASAGVPAINTISIDIRSLEFIRVLGLGPHGIDSLPPGRNQWTASCRNGGENRKSTDDSTLCDFVARGILIHVHSYHPICLS